MDAAEYAELAARAAPFLGPLVDVDDPGYGRVAVAGDAWIRGRAEQYLRGLPDLPLDDGERVDALVVAEDEPEAELVDDAVGVVEGCAC